MVLIALYDYDRWASTKAKNTLRNHRRGQARDHGALGSREISDSRKKDMDL